MLKLPELLDHCSDPNSRKYQYAWQVFMKHYKELIYYNIIKRAREWNIPRLGLQFNDVVNDVFAEVLELLCEHDFRALKNFRSRDSESKLRWYLITICHRACGRYIQRHLGHYVDLEPGDIQEPNSGIAPDTRGQLFEFVVHKLRNHARRSRENLERDINIYLLYVWGDFDKHTIAAHPCYKGKITPKVVDNAVHRMRQILREYKDG